MDLFLLASKSLQLYLLIGAIYSSAPIIVALSATISPDRLSNFIFRESIVATVLGLIFAHGGSYCLSFLGISMAALKLTGGILLFVTGLELLGIRSSKNSILEAENEPFLVPMAFPILTGPATLTTIASFPSSEIVMTDIGMIIAGSATFLTMKLFSLNTKIMSKNAIMFTTKMAGLFVCSLAAQMFLTGFWLFNR